MRHDGSRYDGGSDGILHYKGKILFTHELLLDCLNQQGSSRVPIKAWFRGKVKSWKQAAQGLDGDEFAQCCCLLVAEFIFVCVIQSHLFTAGASFNFKAVCDLLHSKRKMEDKITDAIFDYITLLAIDWDDAFSCKCKPGKYVCLCIACARVYEFCE